MRLFNRIARQTLLIVVVFLLLNLLWPDANILLIDIVTISLVSSIVDELILLRWAPPDRRVGRPVKWILGILALACWAAGFWLTRHSDDRRGWIIGGPVGMAGMSIFSGVRRARAERRRSAGGTDSA